MRHIFEKKNKKNRKKTKKRRKKSKERLSKTKTAQKEQSRATHFE